MPWIGTNHFIFSNLSVKKGQALQETNKAQGVFAGKATDHGDLLSGVRRERKK
jgi:hypothetical protein